VDVDVVPSPKVHAYDAMLPVDELTKLIDRGAVPDVALA
jgi:hypothetical protein